MAKLVSKTYGDALFDLSLEENCVDQMLEDARLVMGAFEQNQDLGRLLNNPKIEKEEKEKVVSNIFHGYVSQYMSGLLALMVAKQRQDEIVGTLQYFEGRVKEYNNIGTAYVTTAVELNEKQKAAVVQKLLETTHYVQFEMNYDIDQSLLGGMVIRIGDKVVDSSIRSKLDSLTKDLKKIQLND